MSTSDSSQLFAGSHVLLRHIVPRHSPNALFFLLFVFVTFSKFIFSRFLSFYPNFLFRKTFHIQFSKISFLLELPLSWSLRTKQIKRLKHFKLLFFVFFLLLRKEVIHPHVPVGIPCYDLTPIISSTLGVSLLTVRITTSGISDSHGLTGGVYNARERIHRDMADSRLLAIPASWSRVADFNPNWEEVYEIRFNSRCCNSLSSPL